MQAKEINTEDARTQKSRKQNHEGKKRLRKLYTSEQNEEDQETENIIEQNISGTQ
jgi:hypothetical protein